VNWNGHYLIGYTVAIVITFLTRAKMVTVHESAPGSTSVISSLLGTGWTSWKDPGAAAATPSASSCDLAPEASLTGSRAGIVDAMNALVADKRLEATAREHAGNYRGRDASNKSRQDKEITIIEFYCDLHAPPPGPSSTALRLILPRRSH